jgi:hypothetical protein
MQSHEVLQRRKEVYAFVNARFSTVQETLRPLVENSIHQWPEGTLATSAKISKGEYLEGLPYIVLDFPRALKGSPKMLFRTLFWWGKGFSCIGFMEGERASKAWKEWLKRGLPQNFRVSNSLDWQYDVAAFPFAGHEYTMTSSRPPLHFWVGSWIPLEQFSGISELAERTYLEWIGLLS